MNPIVKSFLTILMVTTALTSNLANADIYISEVIEGSSNNKAIEIANNGNTPVTLTGYELASEFNGWNNQYDLSGVTIPANDVWVIANSSADATILAIADVTSSSFLVRFSGNDALGLLLNGTEHDVFGAFGFDDFNQNVTLTRCEHSLSTVYHPWQWLEYPVDDFTNLGIFNSEVDSCVAVAIEKNALNTISETADGSGGTPTMDDYTNAGVADVNAQILALVNSAISRQNGSGDVDSAVEIQALVNVILEGQDSDGDNLPNIFEGDSTVDTDGDGTPNRADQDGDNDGIIDALELRITADSDMDGILDVFDADVGNDDTDGTDAGKTDANFDGVNDDVDTLVKLLVLLAADKDNDTLSDSVDADDDGVVGTDIGKTDSNNNGIVDSKEDIALVIQALFVLDIDRDGIVNYLDLDSDNDTLTDVIEAGLPDVDTDAKLDVGSAAISLEASLPNMNADSLPDFIDLKSDGTSNDILRGYFASTAAALDANNDGAIDLNTDADKDGLADVIDTLVGAFGNEVTSQSDLDGDGLSDDVDTDDDNDSILDTDDARTAVTPDHQSKSSSAIGSSSVLFLMSLGLLQLLRVCRLGLLLALLPLSINLWAEESSDKDALPFEAQVSVGQSLFKDDSLQAPLSFSEDRGMHYALGVGYRFHPNFVTQLRYSHFGDAEVNDHQYITYQALSLNLQGELPVNKAESVRLFGLMGLAELNQEGHGLSIADERVSRFHFGGGVKMYSDRFHWGLEVGSYGKEVMYGSLLLGAHF